MNHFGDIGPADIATAAAILRRADADAAHLVADHLADLLAATYRAEPDHDARDQAVREAAELFFGDCKSKARRAELLAALIAQYRSGADWRDRDRFSPSNPYPPGVRRHWLFRILAAVDNAPKANTVRNIIG